MGVLDFIWVIFWVMCFIYVFVLICSVEGVFEEELGTKNTVIFNLSFIFLLVLIPALMNLNYVSEEQTITEHVVQSSNNKVSFVEVDNSLLEVQEMFKFPLKDGDILERVITVPKYKFFTSNSKKIEWRKK